MVGNVRQALKATAFAPLKPTAIVTYATAIVTYATAIVTYATAIVTYATAFAPLFAVCLC